MILLIGMSILAVVFSVMIAIGEAWAEKDWPHDTGKYPVIFAFTTLILVSAL